jgi:hypothetical protein
VILRARFKANAEDYRPVKWPPPGPYWCTGYREGYSIVVAYADSVKEILEYWPEAEDIDCTVEKDYSFSSRFPQPDWWPIENGGAE